MNIPIRILRWLPMILLTGCGNPLSVERQLDVQSPNEASDVKMTTTHDGTPLTPIQQIGRAIMSGDLPLVKRLLAEHPELLHFKDKYMGTWLSGAVLGCQKHIAEWLLEQGLDINYSTETCESPLRNAFTCLGEDEKTETRLR